MPIKQCIILAGGLGTRLRSAVADLPKCMAPVAGKPFLHWVITYLQQQKVTSFILSLGYMHEIIEAYIKKDFPNVDIIFSVESEPLGTGGAIHLAMQLCTEENVLVVNGDTLFETNNVVSLTIHDNGKGFDLSSKPADSESLGMILMNSLTEQLGGTIEFLNDSGAFVRLTFARG